MSYFFSFLLSIWSIFATNLLMVLDIVCAVLYHLTMGTKIQAFERKHGRWKFTKILPMFLMVLSCINVTSVQVASLQVHSTRPVRVKAAHVSSIHLAFLVNKWKELLNTLSAFDKLLDLIESPQPFQVDQHCANKWEEFLAHKALHCLCQGEFASELFPTSKGDAEEGAAPHLNAVPPWTDVTMIE